MTWTVLIADEFEPEVAAMAPVVQEELLALSKLLGRFGPRLGRPHADTLNNSSFANMKELRFKADEGVWRAAFAFDPLRRAILLIAGDKSGGSEKLFYKKLVEKADQRYRAHLDRLAANEQEKR